MSLNQAVPLFVSIDQSITTGELRAMRSRTAKSINRQEEELHDMRIRIGNTSSKAFRLRVKILKEFKDYLRSIDREIAARGSELGEGGILL